LSQVDRLAEAVPVFEQAIRLSPNQAPLRFNLGNTLARLGKRDEAIAAYRESLRIDPDFQPAREALARVGTASQPD
jgi:tetratricopeptide (TPR) repeat protein